MKIVNIILTSQNGGAEQVFIDYLVVLKKLGHDVLAIIKEDAPYANKILELGIEIKKIENNFGDFDFFAVKKINKILREFGSNAVFAHVGRSVVLARKAIKNQNILLVAINHSMNVKRSIGADLILSVNKEIFYRTIDAGQDEAKSFVVPNAIDLSDAIEVAPEIDLKNKSEIIIGLAGRLYRTKGFDFAIRALKKLENISDKKFILKIAGSGMEESNLKVLTQELNLENKVEFCGWVENKKEFFLGIDIFCMSSIEEETFGLVLLEAMKYRKPIVSTNCDGPKEVLRDGVDGLLIEVSPLESLDSRIAEAVLKVVNEKELADKMIQSSFVRLKEKFSFQALENRMKEIVGLG